MPREYGRRVWLLGGLCLAAGVYVGGLWMVGTWTGRPLLDGALGVVAGLYMCSHPAGHAIDLLFFQRQARPAFTSRAAGLGWLALNLLTLLLGWLVIAAGATRLAARSG